MPLMFNNVLRDTGLDPKEVRLVRHKDTSAARGRSVYELWRDSRDLFEQYQSLQRIAARKKFSAPYWAVFVVNLSNETMFAGIYAARYRGLLDKDTPQPHRDGIDKAGIYDVYDLTLCDEATEFIGRLFIDWGAGALAWVQYANRQDKPIVELRRRFKEPEFPGFINFIQSLSSLGRLPQSWRHALQAARGVYLLTCPRTKEQYVGSASGTMGFWGRWHDYVQTGHGGNLGLKSRDPSDYQVSILEVAGSSATDNDILEMEGRWQAKLQSREMGLNRNLAGRSRTTH
ncbi:hypothetical protein DSCA_20790 [Desulfosarcina alkanivorans]|uniref:GIY-YIG domain-containing protein n=1 Tax=Desulfosarcina alkanivorans TaxID=571177 RepID=A0A5K7YJX5_9BACT|nr:GIY-YIG nuclease family protein [Desulfosarcina alkanivorans]BBO68149.1 hypothetical protein DSCA_20790 [Desulfosarcina alkanivorans]